MVLVAAQVHTQMVHDFSFFLFSTGCVVKSGAGADLASAYVCVFHLQFCPSCAPHFLVQLPWPPLSVAVDFHDTANNGNLVQGLDCGLCSRLYMSGGNMGDGSEEEGLYHAGDPGGRRGRRGALSIIMQVKRCILYRCRGYACSAVPSVVCIY